MTENFDEWWKNATDVDRINYMIVKKFVAFQEPDSQIVGTKLYPVVKITKKGKVVRMMAEEGEAYFKTDYFKPIVDFCKPKEWFLTEKRYNEDYTNEYRLLVGLLENGSYVLLASVKPDPHITERFE